MFALEGIDWRAWTAADRCAVAFLMLKRQYKASGDNGSLRELYLLVEDRNAVAELDRQIMGQTGQVMTDG